MADISALLEGHPHRLHNHYLCAHGTVSKTDIVVVKDRAMIAELSKAKNSRPLTFGTANWLEMKILRSLDIKRWQTQDKTLIPEIESLLFRELLGKDISKAPAYQSLIKKEFRRKKTSPGRPKEKPENQEIKPPAYLLKRIKAIESHIAEVKEERDALLRTKEFLKQIHETAETTHKRCREEWPCLGSPIEVHLPEGMTNAEVEILFWMIHRLEKSESGGRLTLNGFALKGISKKRFVFPPWLIPKLTMLEAQIEERISPLMLELEKYEEVLAEYHRGIAQMKAGKPWTPGGLIKAPKPKKEDKWTQKNRTL